MPAAAAHTIAPGAGLSSGYGTLNLNGGLTTNDYTTLAFNLNLGSPISGSTYGGDLIIIGAGSLSHRPQHAISFAGNPTTRAIIASSAATSAA